MIITGVFIQIPRLKMIKRYFDFQHRYYKFIEKNHNDLF